jgi:hypothetical protein
VNEGFLVWLMFFYGGHRTHKLPVVCYIVNSLYF